MRKMFSSLKNKIQEEIGNDVANITVYNQNRRNSSRCNSILTKYTNNFDAISKSSISSSEHVDIIENEFNQKKYIELSEKYDLLLNDYDKMMLDKANIEKTNGILDEALKIAQIQKEFISSEHEKIDNNHLEELTKLKNLLHFREQATNKNYILYFLLIVFNLN